MERARGTAGSSEGGLLRQVPDAEYAGLLFSDAFVVASCLGRFFNTGLLPFSFCIRFHRLRLLSLPLLVLFWLSSRC